MTLRIMGKLPGFMSALVLGSAMWALPACNRESAPPSAEPPMPESSARPPEARTVRVDPGLGSSERIKVATAGRKALADQVIASGSVVSSVDGEARVGALVSGRLASILVREGDRVKKGQVLAWLDAPEAARMQGDYLRGQARLWRAERALEREKQLWENKATSARELQDAEAESRAARAEIEAARGLLTTSRVPVPRDGGSAGLSRIALTSPIEGVVAQRIAIVGGYYGPEDSLFDIVDPTRIAVRADVPEILARRIEADTPAMVTPRGDESGCQGHVHARLERVDPAKRTISVLVALDKPCKGLVSGGFADVALRLSASGSLAQVAVPRAAIVDLDGAPAVFVEGEPRGRGVFEVRLVRVGISDGTDTVIEDGVREGEAVVVVGAFLLKGEHLRSAMGGE